jgi:hypothetical protein
MSTIHQIHQGRKQRAERPAASASVCGGVAGMANVKPTNAIDRDPQVEPGF